MAGRIDEVQFVVAALVGESQADGLRLDRDAALALEVHRVEELVVHLARGDSARDLQDTVGKRRLTVIDVGDDAEVADEGRVHAPHSSRGFYEPSPLPAASAPSMKEPMRPNSPSKASAPSESSVPLDDWR